MVSLASAFACGRFATFDSCHGEVCVEATRFISLDIGAKGDREDILSFITLLSSIVTYRFYYDGSSVELNESINVQVYLR